MKEERQSDIRFLNHFSLSMKRNVLSFFSLKEADIPHVMISYNWSAQHNYDESSDTD